ncbi:MAG TPA: tRNA-dihydrouridine synthase [Candidatus Paceibacterota bacterium]|nr:tRNA-dihydrouridine synthase [Candidatus Paceibacterota bacterium]
MKNFWDSLPRPFFVLAPLANVTDAAFRRIIAKYSKPEGPNVFWTEFVSADGLALAHEEGRNKLLRDLLYSEAERPIVAQFFTATPEHMEHAAALAQELGFDGIDINMGCPDKTIEKQGAGAKLILNPERAVELIAAAKRGAPNLPISVKTRLGYNKDILEEWLPKLLAAEPAALTLHARTRKEMSLVPAHWERVKRAVEIRNELGSKTLIIGNGDALDVADARKKATESGADGVMLGRAIFGKPWLFSSVESAQEKVLGSPVSRRPLWGALAGQTIFPDAFRLQIAVEHTKLFEELLGDIKNFAIMKKHFKAYVEGFDGAKELRMQLMEAKNAAEVESLIESFLASR